MINHRILNIVLCAIFLVVSLFLIFSFCLILLKISQLLYFYVHLLIDSDYSKGYNSQHISSASYMPDIVLGVLHIVTHLIFTITQ